MKSFRFVLCLLAAIGFAMIGCKGGKKKEGEPAAAEHGGAAHETGHSAKPAHGEEPAAPAHGGAAEHAAPPHGEEQAAPEHVEEHGGGEEHGGAHEEGAGGGHH